MTAFLYEIIATADVLRAARAPDGSQALRFDREWQLLTAVERCGNAPSFSHLARLLGVSRQAARNFALTAVKANLVKLLPASHDQRVWLVALTPAGRRAIEAQQMPAFSWAFALLREFELAKMRAANRVLYALRRRLESDERARVAARQFGSGSPFTNAISPRTWR
jgi:DNA-binding MarR family transcriptional regulator